MNVLKKRKDSHQGKISVIRGLEDYGGGGVEGHMHPPPPKKKKKKKADRKLH